VEVPVLRGMLTKSTLQVTREPARKPVQKKITSQTEHAADFLVGLMLQEEEYIDQIVPRVAEDDFIDADWRNLYKDLVLLYTAHKSSSSTQNSFFTAVQQHLSKQNRDEDISRLNASAIRAEESIAEYTPDQVREEIDRHIDVLTSSHERAKRKQLEAAIRQAESSGDSERLEALLEQYTKLIS
jgi:replicative DNA helicase